MFNYHFYKGVATNSTEYFAVYQGAYSNIVNTRYMEIWSYWGYDFSIIQALSIDSLTTSKPTGSFMGFVIILAKMIRFIFYFIIFLNLKERILWSGPVDRHV